MNAIIIIKIIKKGNPWEKEEKEITNETKILLQNLPSKDKQTQN